MEIFLQSLLDPKWLVVYMSLPLGDAPPFSLVSAGVAAVAGVLLLAFAFRRELDIERGNLWSEKSSLQGRISEAEKNLRDAARLVEEISSEIEVNREKLETLHAEAEKNRNLASLHEKQATAVRDLVSNTVAQGNRELSRSATRQQAAFFFAGALLSPFAQMFIVWLLGLLTGH